VEEETLSCGTGATASAAMAHKLGLVGATGATVQVETKGGLLTIYLADGAKMEGAASTVFFGAIIF
jgi:diaminopimelate epimerase